MLAAAAVLVFVITLLIGVPIAFVLGLTSMSVAYLRDYSFLQWCQRFFSGLDSFTLLAVPLFVLAGEMMNTGGITRRLIRFSQTIVGRIRGGLAQTNVVVSMLFAGVSGSAVADTSAIGSILIPAMVDEGYEREFSAAITVASSTVGPIIPPSILMVLYGVTAGVSIGPLFLAGIIPGVVLGISLMVMAYLYARSRNYPKYEVELSLKEFLETFKDALIPLFAPIIIIGGILSGVFTATEAAAVTVFYAFVVTFIIYRELKLKHLPQVFFSSALLTGIILIIIGFADTLAWIFSMERLGQLLAHNIMNFTESALMFLLIINIFLLFVGTFMEAGAAIIVLAPILAPMATNHYGIHPLHFGIIMVLNLVIALATPPVGLSLFVGSKISGVGIKDLSLAIFPFLGVLILVLLAVTYIPAIPMWLPGLLGFYP